MDGATTQRLADGAACLAAALEFLRLGWSPLALCPPDHVGIGRVVKDHGKTCGSPGKRPWHTWKEFQNRRPTEAELRELWKLVPNSNVGVALGPVSGLIRVDVEGESGEQRLAELSAGDLPATLEFVSGRPSGGRGLLYGIPPGAQLRTTFEKPAPGEELRLQAQGAQTALPPSRHPSGAIYAWKPGRGPADLLPTVAPAWLLQALARPEGSRSPTVAAQGWEAIFGGVEQGGRNEAMAAVVGKLVANLRSIDGGDAKAAWWAVQAINERNSPPLPEGELRTIFKSILGREATRRASCAEEPEPEPPPTAEPHANGKPTNGTLRSGWGVVIDGEVAIEGKPEDLDKLGLPVRQDVYQCFEILSLRGLMAANYPEPKWAVQGLLAEGLNLLAGSPKSGKSMMALNLALTVAGGGMALGSMRTVAGDVLYLSLEDQFRRVQARAKKMTALMTGEVAQRLSVCTKWPRIHKGGLMLLKQWLERVENPRLLIVDVLGKFRPPSNARGNQYEQDSEHLYEIKEFADENGLTVLLLHHTRKLVGKDKDRDEFEDVSGTQGISGACDGILMLKRARQSNDAVVSVTGRDDEEQKLALLFDPATLTWKNQGSAEEHLMGKLQLKVLEYMKVRAGVPSFVSQISEDLEADAGSIRKTLHRLMDKGVVCRHGLGWKYPVADGP